MIGEGKAASSSKIVDVNSEWMMAPETISIQNNEKKEAKTSSKFVLIIFTMEILNE